MLHSRALLLALLGLARPSVASTSNGTLTLLGLEPALIFERSFGAGDQVTITGSAWLAVQQRLAALESAVLLLTAGSSLNPFQNYQGISDEQNLNIQIAYCKPPQLPLRRVRSFSDLFVLLSFLSVSIDQLKSRSKAEV